MGRSGSSGWWLGQLLSWVVAAMSVASLAALTAPASPQPDLRAGLALIVGGAAIVVAGLLDRWWPAAVVGAGSIALGVLLRLDAVRYETTVGYALAGASVLGGLVAGWWLRRIGFRWLVTVTAVLIGAGIGWLFVRYQTELLPLGVGAVGLAVASLVGLGFVMSAPTVRAGGGQARLRDATGALRDWVEQRLADTPASGDERDVVAKLFFEGDDRRQRLARFYTLMAFASLIASLGILADSTAVVIGAMLIAPLMTPLMAMSLSVVSQWTERLARATFTVVTGALIPVAVGVLVTATLGQGVDPTVNSQILSRGSPTLLDLAVAIGAGAAGAFAHSRRDVSDSLPGVAVAIALVPPLAVVGAAAQLGDWQSSRGALLLFLTNAIAIVAVGALTFVMTGIARAPGGVRGVVGHWVVAFSVFGFAVLWALMASTSSNNEIGARTSMATSTIETWGETYSYDVASVLLVGDSLDVVLIGESAPDDEAVDELLDQLNRLVDVAEVEVQVDLTATITAQLD